MERVEHAHVERILKESAIEGTENSLVTGMGEVEAKAAVADLCRKYTRAPVSEQAVVHVIRLLGTLLEDVSDWPTYESEEQQKILGWPGFRHDATRMLLATGCTFALPPLLPCHALLLTAKDLFEKRHGWLWRKLACFLVAAPAPWWGSASHTFVLPVYSATGFVLGSQLFKPKHVCAGDCFRPSVIRRLAAQGSDISKDGDVPGQSFKFGSRKWAPQSGSAHIDDELPIDLTMVVMGVVWRMRTDVNIPVLLVGDFSTARDVTVCQVASKLLGFSFKITRVQSLSAGQRGADLDHAENELLLLQLSASEQPFRQEHFDFLAEELDGTRRKLISLDVCGGAFADASIGLPQALRDYVVAC